MAHLCDRRAVRTEKFGNLALCRLLDPLVDDGLGIGPGEDVVIGLEGLVHQVHEAGLDGVGVNRGSPQGVAEKEGRVEILEMSN